MSHKPRTWIFDVDGTILVHKNEGACKQWSGPAFLELCPGVRETFNEIERNCGCIVLITTRPECARPWLEGNLRYYGLFWHHLIMGVPSGPRVLVNDSKPTHTGDTAFSLTVERNGGLELCKNYEESWQKLGAQEPMKFRNPNLDGLGPK